MNLLAEHQMWLLFNRRVKTAVWRSPGQVTSSSSPSCSTGCDTSPQQHSTSSDFLPEGTCGGTNLGRQHGLEEKTGSEFR